MAIRCGHCGGEHASPAEVRTCSLGGHAVHGMPGSVAPSGAAAPAPPPPAALPHLATVRRGPVLLGRHVLVRHADHAPAEWSGAPVVPVGADALEHPETAVDILRRAAHEQVGAVLVVDDVLHDRLDHWAPQVETRPPYELGPRWTPALDELHHLLTANSIDLRDPAAPRSALVHAALAAGAATHDAPVGDVVLPDGTTAWLDGGPVRRLPPVDGVAVLHRVAVEHGSLRPPTVEPPAAALAPDQLAAVGHEGGAARIVAPAGSGKTRVLTERARHLLREWRLPPSAVTLVAFNKRAQEEMRERTSDLPGLQVRTLNSIALAIIDGSPPFAPQPRRWTTLDEGEVRQIIGRLVAFPRRRNTDPVAPWIEALGLIRLGLRPPAAVEADEAGDTDGLAEVWPAYRAELERRRAVDFDDQVYRAIELLLADPTARLAAQRACRVLLVDEFQDLTPAHLLLVRLLAGAGGSVFGVGDDDQTIYGYNGADPAWLIDFTELFPGAGDHPLTMNYRCPGGIVDAVDRLLRHNVRRVPKLIRAESTRADGWSVEADVQPVATTTALVRRALDGGRSSSEIAVLTRVNAVLAPVQVALVAAGVPVSGGVGTDFLERTAVRSSLAWLRLATSSGPWRADDVSEALRRPSRPMHPRIAGWVSEQRDVDGLRRLATRITNEREAERILEFADDIVRMHALASRGAGTAALVAELIDGLGLAGTVASLDDSRRGMNRSAQGDDLTAIRQLAALHDDPADFESWLRHHLAAPRSVEGVVLATVHRVKGQEWPEVVVHLAADDQYPHRLADDVEEERRLFHVALTRASHHATIVTGDRPSPFVAELTTEPPPPGTVAPPRPPIRSAGPPPRRSARSDDVDPTDATLFDALKAWRAGARGDKPAYTVFADATLGEIARRRPTSLAELARVKGVGPAKLEQYGDDVLGIVADHAPA